MRATWIIVIVAAGCGGTEPRSTEPTPAPIADDDPDEDRIAAGDACPDEVERYNGFEDDDGCPDRPPEDQCVWEDVIHIAERVAFAASSSEIEEPQREVIAVLAQTLVANPTVERVAVVGAAGPDEPSPVPLATARAEAVRDALVALGVEGSRLEAHTRMPRPGAPVVWFAILRVDGRDTRDEDHPDADRLLPYRLDCEADYAAWRERGELRNCDCVERPER